MPAAPIGQQIASQPAPMPQADLAPEPKPMAAAPPKSAEERRKAIAAKAQSETAPAAPSQSFFASPMGMAAIGGAVLLLVAIVVMRRRRAAQDEEDPLYTVMSAEDQSAIAGISAEIGTSRPAAPSWDSAAFETSEPAFVKDGPRQLPLGSRSDSEAPVETEPEPEPVAAADDAADSIFASDLRPLAAPEPVSAPAAAAPIAASPAPVSADMERRIGELERRLEQLTEARERLERQVAAQTEELRVQRAAIARTQRVVRSIAKTEDMATEPVPRAPSA
jgi:2-oxoglutarate dehydrogenase E2 component (dihydrolipoamide succinyltransferase)